MSLEAFERAQKAFTALQRSADFEHFGEDSRGIRIQTDSLIVKIATLAQTQPEKPVVLMGALIRAASEDYGTYVRVKGGVPNCWVGIDVRGLIGPLSEDSTSGEFQKALMRRSGVSIDLRSDGSSIVSAHSAFLEIDGLDIAKVINRELDKLSDQQRCELADALADIIAQEVAESGEFLDL